MNEWILYVMTWASQLSGYPFPDKLPEVRWESEGWFSHRACEDHIPCPIFGLYEDAHVIFLREDLTDSAKDHVAVHEFVHYLQDHSERRKQRVREETNVAHNSAPIALEPEKQGSLSRVVALSCALLRNC